MPAPKDMPARGELVSAPDPLPPHPWGRAVPHSPGLSPSLEVLLGLPAASSGPVGDDNIVICSLAQAHALACNGGGQGPHLPQAKCKARKEHRPLCYQHGDLVCNKGSRTAVCGAPREQIKAESCNVQDQTYPAKPVKAARQSYGAPWGPLVVEVRPLALLFWSLCCRRTCSITRASATSK